MAKQEFYYIRVDRYGKWTPCEYRKVSCEELDELIDHYGKHMLSLCSNGEHGAMAMWAFFKNKIGKGCYNDMINAYRLLSNDSKSLVGREHELRHVWEEYEELWRIRYHGTVEAYFLSKAEESRKRQKKYMQVDCE